VSRDLRALFVQRDATLKMLSIMENGRAAKPARASNPEASERFSGLVEQCSVNKN
jgi:hypothetical protein